MSSLVAVVSELASAVHDRGLRWEAQLRELLVKLSQTQQAIAQESAGWAAISSELPGTNPHLCVFFIGLFGLLVQSTECQKLHFEECACLVVLLVENISVFVCMITTCAHSGKKTTAQERCCC